MSRDLRRYTRQTNFRLGLGFVLLLFIVGDGMIYLTYGPSAAVTGFICLLAALVPVAIIGLFLYGIEWIVKKSND